VWASAVLAVPIHFTSYAADLPSAPTANSTSGNNGKEAKPSEPKEAKNADSVPSGPGDLNNRNRPSAIPVVQAAIDADIGGSNEDFWVKGRSKRGEKRHEVSLGEFVVIRLEQEFRKNDGVGKQMGLYINDLYFKDLPPMPVPGRQNAVMFQLKRTDRNRDLWSLLYANKSFQQGPKPETCINDDNDRIYVTAGLEDGTQIGPAAIACLEYFPNGWSTWLPTTSAVLLIAAILLLAWKTSMLRDPGVPPDGKKTPWSLARCQMTLWFITVISSVLFAYAVTGDISPIPDGVLILMGIGAGTAVSSRAIDASKTGTRADYEVAKKLQPALDQAVIIASEKVSAAEAANPPDAKLPILKTSLAEEKKAADDNRAKVRSFEVPASRAFF
jgi:hypothetical protein